MVPNGAVDAVAADERGGVVGCGVGEGKFDRGGGRWKFLDGGEFFIPLEDVFWYSFV